MKIIVFDTETNGLPARFNAPMSELDNWPRMTQLAYCVYENGEIIHEFKSYIKPDGWEVPNEPFWSERGITTEFLNENGIGVQDALIQMIKEIDTCSLMVAHNIDFDYNVLGSEMIRSGLKSSNKPEKFCTMKNSTSICKLLGKYGYKFPKLIELYQFLFGEDFDGAHDALADVKATGRCYFELLKKFIKPEVATES